MADVNSLGSGAVVEPGVPDRSVLDYAKETTAMDPLIEIGNKIGAATVLLDKLIKGKQKVRIDSNKVYLDTDFRYIHHFFIDFTWRRERVVGTKRFSVGCHTEADAINTTLMVDYRYEPAQFFQNQAPKQLPPENGQVGWDRYADTYNDLVERHGIMMGKYKEVCGEE